MKKILGLVMIVALTVMGISSVFAAEKKDNDKKPLIKTDSKPAKNSDVLFDQGSVAVNLSVGFGYGFSPAFYPGVEFGVYKLYITESIPLTIGVSAKGILNFYSEAFYGYTWSTTTIGAGVFATAHFSTKCLKINSFLDRVDYYYAIGLAFNYVTVGGTWADYYRQYYGRDYVGAFGTGLGIATYGGAAYYITDNFLVFAEGNYWAYYGGGAVGVGYKF